jgi:glutamyl-tRNA reductase
VKLFTIDNLRDINEATLSSRKAAAETAHVHVEEEINRSIRLLNRTAADDTLAQLYTWAEAGRLRERDKAIARLPAGEEKAPEIIEDLSRVLVKKLLADATMSIRQCAEAGNLTAAESLVQAITRGEHTCFRKEG